ncbi:GNAT family N-acetyltransferase [Herbaspirillum rubrisubalbicans]|uniref:GNAT family N-acetyltransferase n=1 Tax=Herbaspirillum rubrisubalbicans TaxID=80842 RepID=UPI001558AC09|nr:GNAT family N-acetyltransferase [Herbaspirillum rubrisubalbicans]
MSSSYQVRQISKDDGETLRSIRIAALTDAPYAFGATLEEALAQPLDEFDATAVRHATSETSTSFFLNHEMSVVGTVGAFIEAASSGQAYICALWLEPNHRGSNGATMLVDEANRWLFTRGVESVNAWVANSNARAAAFYRKFGFTPTARTQRLPSGLYIILCKRTIGRKLSPCPEPQ